MLRRGNVCFLACLGHGCVAVGLFVFQGPPGRDWLWPWCLELPSSSSEFSPWSPSPLSLPPSLLQGNYEFPCSLDFAAEGQLFVPFLSLSWQLLHGGGCSLSSTTPASAAKDTPFVLPLPRCCWRSHSVLLCSRRCCCGGEHRS